ncbi:MAG: response regulator transcription factor [Caldilineaceae bacterium]|nr:response regulator transcription factor [Caldilineaceae bacterium]HRJ43215.1 response regulator transcription factor [Caldilineaceae bacterium]
MDSILPDKSGAELPRILVVDDDPAIVRLVRSKLDMSGYLVMTAGTGREALERIAQNGLPHLAIVDINMPEMDGFEFCRTVQQYADLPVILLTAMDQEEMVIQGIEHFAEDYVTKPFSPRELVARVGRVLRRMGDFAYTLDPIAKVDQRLSVDFVHQQVILNGETISLTPTETKILFILMRNAGRTVTNDFLLRRIWPLDEIFEDTLRVHIHRLRQKIEAKGGEARYIATERGIGYRFLVKAGA